MDSGLRRERQLEIFPRFARTIRQILYATAADFRMPGVHADVGTIVPAANAFLVLAALRRHPDLGREIP